MSLKTSCIQHPPQSDFLTVHRWQIKACDGNACAGALLAFFERWHNVKLAMQGQARQANRAAENHGDEPGQYDGLLQWHSTEDLVEGVMFYKRDAVNAALKILVEKGFIEVHKNPNPRYNFDKTRHFLFMPDIVNKWLASDARKTDNPCAEYRERSTENLRRSTEYRERSTENRQAIPEETTEETSEETSEEVCGGVIGSNYAPPPPQKWPDEIHKALTEIGSVGLIPSPRDRMLLIEGCPALVAQCGTPQAAADEIRRRFRPGVWQKDRPPYVSQVFSEWDRQRAVADSAARDPFSEFCEVQP